jgi:hypothetical protein
MEHEFTCVELSDEQLDLVVGGGGGTSISQLAAAVNSSGSNGVNQQNANATNQAAVGGGSNWNTTWQTNFFQSE